MPRFAKNTTPVARADSRRVQRVLLWSGCQRAVAAEMFDSQRFVVSQKSGGRSSGTSVEIYCYLGGFFSRSHFSRVTIQKPAQMYFHINTSLITLRDWAS
jgi:hypothetical protein